MLPAGFGAEGIAVTPQGEVWLGGLRGNVVSIYGFVRGERRLDQLKLLKQIYVPKPLRLAYEASTNTVGVVSYEPKAGASEINFRSFDAKNHSLVGATVLKSSVRGRINSQGLAAANGVFITGGFNNQTIVIVDPKTLKVSAEILMPRCSLPAGYNSPTPMTEQAAIKQKQTGANNWSGGVCPGTMRNPDDRRFAVMDGFTWSPQDLSAS